MLLQNSNFEAEQYDIIRDYKDYSMIWFSTVQ